MNNLNDPPGWNIPLRNPGDPAAHGNQWNYALLVPMLGLAAFRWIWSRQSQQEVQSVRAQYSRDVSMVTGHLEAKYRQSLTEGRRSAALLEVQLEEERQRVRGLRHALLSHGQQLAEERRRLQQERDALEDEKRRVLESGAAGHALRRALDRESEWEGRASARLRQLEGGLVERQSAFCSLLLPRETRLDMEKELLLKAVKEPLGGDVDLETDLKDIFKNDRHCADLLNTDRRRNGSLMWVYLRYWQLQVAVQKHRRAEGAVLGAEDAVLGARPDFK